MKELKAIEIEINSHCNRACSYCPNVDQSRIEQGVMSKELFHKILTQLQEIEYSGRISFSFYNEPLLVQDLEYYAGQVKAYLPACNILIYTNGTLLTLPRLEGLLSAGVDYFVITKHESEKDYAFDQLYLSLPTEIVDKHIKYQSYKDLKLTNRGGLLPKIQKDVESKNLPCSIPLHMMTITNKGSVVPCFEDYHQVHSMGNIEQRSLNDIWNSSEYVILRKKLLMGFRKDYEVCSKCNRNEMLGVY